MKKTWKSSLFGCAAILYLLMTFVTACGKKATPAEEAINEMTSAMKEITSVRMSLAVDWVPVGESAITLKTDIEQMKEPMDSHTVLTVTQGKGSTSQELYVIKEEQMTYSYVKEKNGWSVHEGEAAKEELGRPIFLTSGSGWEISEETEWEGVPCTILTGYIPKDKISQILKASGLSSSKVRTDVTGVVTLYQDNETKLPLSITIDLGALGDMESFLIQCVYNGFNDLDAIILPEEVKSATAF